MATNGSATVQLLVFSGRPDPEWTTEATEVEALSSAVSGVVGGQRHDGTPPEGGLGYRGIRVVNAGGAAGLPASFTVFQGVLTDGSDGTSWVGAGALENQLLAAARQRGYGEILDSLGVGAARLA